MSTIVNQIPYDFYSMEVELATTTASFGIIKGVEEVDYGVKFNREKQRGGSRKPTHRTTGDIDPDASITLLKSWFDYILAKARELKIPLADLSMAWTINYAHKGEVLHTDTLTEVAFAEIRHSFKRGPEGLMVSVPLDIMNVYYDGVDVFGDTL